MALQQIYFLFLIQQIQIGCLAPRQNVDLDLLLRHRAGLGGRSFELRRQPLKLIIGLLVSQITLLHPALFAPGRAHAQEALALHALQNPHPFAVMHHAGLVIDGRNMIAQAGISNRDIGVFTMVRRAPAATAT